MSRFLLVLAILFACLSPALAQDEAPSLDATLAFLKQQLETRPNRDYYGVYVMGNKVGWTWMEARFEEDRFVLEDFLFFEMNAMGNSTRMENGARRTYDLKDGRLIEVTSTQKGQMGEARFLLYRDGDGKDFAFRTEVGEQTRVTPMPDQGENLRTMVWMDYLAAKGTLQPGQTFPCSTFDPGTGRWLTQMGRYVNSETKLFNGVETKIHVFSVSIEELGMQSRSVYDEHGTMLETQVGGLLTLRLESEEQAKSHLYQHDVLVATTIQAKGKSLRGARKARTVRYDVQNLDPRWRVNTAQQTWDTDGRTVTVRAVAPPAEHATPLAGPEALSVFLKADARIQSDHPAIRNQARELIQGIADNKKRVETLSAWVYKSLRKEFSAVYSNALDTLREKRGDCGEHAVLLTALLRSVGIPAREVGGLIYSETLNGFGFHAWVQAHHDGQWHDLDPSWNQAPVDPLHIALGFGSLENLTGAVLGGSSIGLTVKDVNP